ncbi:hypothetical protein JTB14_012896 [Gonioctena quinquepunctata]|nr:hypothetical protein JTB14_012896 [Gonioctena quinquepunctata]
MQVYSTCVRPSNAIKDCCGGPYVTRIQEVTTLKYKAVPEYTVLSVKSATLGRIGSYSAHAACDVVQSGLKQQTHPDRILWKFDCDIDCSNSPDVVNRTLPNASLSGTTTL